MSKGSINFNENAVEYYTPKYIVDKFGKFDYDPATTDEKAKEFGIADYDTVETDGLKRDWTKFKKIWINPPFNQKKEFLQKAVDTLLANQYATIYILLPIAYLCTKAFHDIMKTIDNKYDIFIPNGRIKFETGDDKKLKTPAFGSVIIQMASYSNLDVCLMDITNN